MTTRGVYAEGKVHDFLKMWAETHLGFCYNRILDAKASMGAISNPQPGDFQWFMDTGLFAHHPSLTSGKFKLTRNGLIEVKEVAHAYRLPHKNFGADQVGRMRIRQYAGSEPLILVCARPPGERIQWFSLPLDFFQAREGGSWDLRGQISHDSPEAILRDYLS